MKIGGNNFIFDYLYKKIKTFSHFYRKIKKKSRNHDLFSQIKTKSRKSRLVDTLDTLIVIICLRPESGLLNTCMNAQIHT